VGRLITRALWAAWLPACCLPAWPGVRLQPAAARCG